jgi:hypothetical protein
LKNGEVFLPSLFRLAEAFREIKKTGIMLKLNGTPSLFYVLILIIYWAKY